MKGKYRIIVRNRRVSFTVEAERNITILTGESATGKTSMYNMIRQYETLGKQSGVTIQCDVPCRVLETIDWEAMLNSIHQSIVFVDEGQSFIYSDEFAGAIRDSDNYYVLITRESLPNLPYSVKAVLELKKTTSRFKRTYNRTYPIYEKLANASVAISTAECIVTEDANSGNQFFQHLAGKSNTECVSALGKSNLPSIVQKNAEKRTVVIADGAAFGSEMKKVYELFKDHADKIQLYLPESFEWVLLKADLLHDKEIRKILNNPADYIDSEEYFSWERFFTELLISKTKKTEFRYSKQNLNKVYLLPAHVEKILQVISGESEEN